MKQPSPKNFFLIDGLGAIVSAIMLGVVLVRFEEFFGMPAAVLYGLAGAAAVFAVYSFSCHFFFMEKWQPFLRLIGTVNLLYCGLTLGMVIYWQEPLTAWGIAYFVGEMAIVVTLAITELGTAKKNTIRPAS